MSLNGKVAFLTGGVGGIGQCITKNLLESGVTVILFDLNKARGEEVQKKLEAEHGKGKVHFISGSVTKKEDIEAAFKEAVDKYSRIDIMFNNAGIMDDAVWEAEIDINLKGVVYGTHVAMKHMSKEHGGQGGMIVNTASILGLVPFVLTPVYTATKHAVIGFTRSFGYPQLYEKTGVKVIAVCPGMTETELLTGGSFGTMFQAFISNAPAEQRQKHPTQKPDAIGAAIPKILQEASNGSIWVVEGGKPGYEISIPFYPEWRVNKA